MSVSFDPKFIHFAKAASTLSTGLLAYWDFAETTGNYVDEVAGYTTANNGIAHDASGINDYCIQYVANTDDVTVSNGNWKGTNDAYTISCWFKINNTSSTLARTQLIHRQFNNTASVDATYIDLPPDGNYLSFSVRSTVPTQYIITTSGVSFSTGVWYHVVCVNIASGTKGKIYINGSDVTDAGGGTFSGTRLIADGTMRVGCSTTSTTVAIDGYIDELAVWDRAITAGEVTELYNAGAGKFYPF